MNLEKYKVVILDCDGVIFDSNYLKISAFKDALSNFDGSIVDRFIEYLKSNFGVSRYNLIKVFLENFIEEDFDKEQYYNILKAYSQNCIILYEQSRLTKDFLKFVEKYRDKRFYVASGSDQEELRMVFKNRGLEKYFVSIYGSPTNKSEIVNNIVNQNKNTVMIGDSKSDMFASINSGIDFIFMRDYSTSQDMNKYKDIACINNLGDLV